MFTIDAIRFEIRYSFIMFDGESQLKAWNNLIWTYQISIIGTFEIYEIYKDIL